MTLRVVLDGTPLLGQPTGVGVFVRGLIDELHQVPEIELAAFGLTARRTRDLADHLPEGTQHNLVPMPAGVLTRFWAHTSHPAIERWVGSCDVVHGTNFVVPPSVRGGQLVTVHDLTSVRYPEMCEPATLRYPELIRAAVKRGAHVHTLSTFVADEVQELLGVPAERIHVIPTGLRAAIETNASASPLPDLTKYILAIGTIEPRKDFPTLVRAFELLAATDRDVHLVIAGAPGWGSPAFESSVARSVNRARIHYLGRIDDDAYAALLRNARVLAYPSIYEGFGLPPLEAMRAGIPVVATAVASLPEVCGDAAVLVPPNDETSLASALADVLDNDITRQALIDKGHARAGALSWQTAGAKFVELYRALAC